VNKRGFYKSLRDKAHRWDNLSAQERGIFLRAFILLLLVTASLKTVGFRRTQAWLTVKTFRAFARPVEETRAEVWRTALLVRSARKWQILPITCLSHSLVLWKLLRRQGIDSDIRIGVRRGTFGQVEAHAWIEWNGEVLNDCADIAAQYAPFNGAISTALNFD
jgi:hypothetical protein